MILDFERLPEETEEELIYRICSQKENNPSWTWNDVSDTLNYLLSNSYTESKYRKQYSSFQKMLLANKEKFVDDNYSKELDKKYEDIKKERIKLQTLNVERNRIDRQDSRRELYFEYIGDLVTALPFPNFQPLLCRVSENNKEYILCISDIHDGATFKSMNNEYSFDIVEKRFRILLNKTINFVKEKNLNTIKILNTGDTIQGMIHTNDLRINDSTVVKSVVHSSRVVAMFLIVCPCIATTFIPLFISTLIYGLAFSSCK